jgi:hypothetical protein
MIETIIEPIMDGLVPVLAMALLIGIIVLAAGVGIVYVLTVVWAFDYHWLIGCVVAFALFIVYVLIASFLVGLSMTL